MKTMVAIAVTILSFVPPSWLRADGYYAPVIFNWVMAGDLAEVKKLLDADPALVNIQDTNGDTPIFFALGRRRDMVDLLLERGADVKIRNRFGQTLLHRAAAGGELDLVRLFLSRGLDINAVDNEGRTPLFLAANMGEAETADFLIAQHAIVHPQDFSGPLPYNADIDALIAALKNPDGNVWSDAAIRLQKRGMKAKKAVPALVQLYQNKEPTHRGYSVLALANMGFGGAPTLVHAKEDSDTYTKMQAYEAVGKMNPVLLFLATFWAKVFNLYSVTIPKLFGFIFFSAILTIYFWRWARSTSESEKTRIFAWLAFFLSAFIIVVSVLSLWELLRT